MHRHHIHSFRLIRETPLPDFTDEARHEIACIARYHRRALPSMSHEEYASLSRRARKRVSALAALLRVADALDYSHDGRVLSLVLVPKLCNNSTWTIALEIRPRPQLDKGIVQVKEASAVMHQNKSRSASTNPD